MSEMRTGHAAYLAHDDAPLAPQGQDKVADPGSEAGTRLIEQLRDMVEHDVEPNSLMNQAAAALEALQAEGERLREEVAGGERMHRQWHDRASRAERALDHLQLAEHHYRATHAEFGDGHKYTKRAWDDLKREGNIARAALAEPGS